MLCPLDPKFVTSAYLEYYATEKETEESRQIKQLQSKLKKKGYPARFYLDIVNDGNKKVFIRTESPDLVLRMKTGCFGCMCLYCIFQNDHGSIISSSYRLPETVVQKVEYKFGSDTQQRKFLQDLEKCIKDPSITASNLFRTSKSGSNLGVDLHCQIDFPGLDAIPFNLAFFPNETQETIQKTKTFSQYLRVCLKNIKSQLLYQDDDHNNLQLLPHQMLFLSWLRKTIPSDPDEYQNTRKGEEMKTPTPASGGGVLLYAAMASGKTKSTLASLTKLRWHVRNVLIVTTNTLIDYWKDSVKTIWDTDWPETKYTIMGYVGFVKLCESCFDSKDRLIQVPEQLNKSVVVLDENYLRNALKSRAMIRTLYVLMFSKYTIALTATPLMNNVWIELPYHAAILKSVPSGLTFSNFVEILNKLRSRILETITDGTENIEGDDISKDGKVFRIPEITTLSSKVIKLVDYIFRNKTFYYDPRTHDPDFYDKHFPKLIEIRREVPMSWMQTLYYFMGKRQIFRLCEDLIIQSPSRNSYASHERRLANTCPEEKRFSNKVQMLVSDLLEERKLQIPTERVHPCQVIKTTTVEDGLIAISKCLKSKLPTLRIEMVSGQTPLSKRQPIFDAFVRGELDVLGLCKVGTVGVNLDGRTNAFFLFDQGDTAQDDSQSFGRVARMDKKRDFRKETPIRVYRYISTFPKTSMTPEEKQAIWKVLSPLLSHAKIKQDGFDIEAALRKHISEEKHTINELVEERNVKKQKLIALFEREIQRLTLK
jgi:hypothetical protein